MKNWFKRTNLLWLALIMSTYIILNVLISAGIINNVYQTVLLTIGINIILAISLNLIIGITGQFSLGHAGFMIIGAYSCGVVLKLIAGGTVGVLLGILIGMAISAAASGECEYGIVICGTGIGISITANKVPGIRCALCTDCFMAQATKEHNDANMLAFGARVLGAGTALKIVDTFLDTPFSNDERHKRRIAKIEKGE